MTKTADPAAEAAKPLLPLFYKTLQPLHGKVHGDWRLKPGDCAFAADSPFVPIVVGELADAARDYPVVFAGDPEQPVPVVILGLDRVNLFVEDGQWDKGAHIPAYVRRYPFNFLSVPEPEGFALTIDAGSDRVARGGTEGAALFEDGKPSEVTRQMLAFCNAFRVEADATRAFTLALKAQGLLVDGTANATLPNGRTLGLNGFQIVDTEKFSKLPDAVVLDWHNSGYLAWVYYHMASLSRFKALYARQVARGAVTQASPVPASDTDTAGVAPESDAPATKSKSKKVPA
ncbi:SapC family protein [Sandaracinobacter sp. RS1-74]|uniref:SapC family protein n=1 Tax=Sandaracinobacteroides sayramensis TaxID=2913411 RepID=UPI001EDA2E47|nr:SapC family protein [Sandaracinobacteroides sayramensis]MCG2841223.1 SapC family protein [Sandaracinobacteroides sayramensis]